MTTIHVLLVEDNVDNQDMMKFLLERAGYVVLTANTGREALDITQREKPDIVLMDLSMPDMDGWTAAREMKKDPALADIPLIAVTAHTLPGDRRKVLDSGFDSYMSKPINVRMFDIMVAKVLEEKTQNAGNISLLEDESE
jgi:two-component system, cell cycle response regulator DivK